jgi:hypothetical protein
MYVLISHSEPLPKPTGLKGGTAGKVLSGTKVGKYLGEYWSNERQIPIIPILVSGKIYQFGLPTEVEISSEL